MAVLYVDKTGTITMNQLAVTGMIPLEQAAEADRNSIDLAFLAAARERHLFDAVPAVTAVSFQPFEPQSRRTILKMTNENALGTFSLQTLLYLAVFSIVSANEQTQTTQPGLAKG